MEIGRLAILTVVAVVGVAVIMIVAENPGRYAVSANKSAPTFRLADCTH